MNLDAVGRAVAWLEARDQPGRNVFARGRTDENGAVKATRAAWSKGPAALGGAGLAREREDITALLRTCLAALRLPPDAGAAFRLAGPPIWSAQDATQRIRVMLPNVGEAGVGLEAFLPEVLLDAPERDLRCRVAVAGTFLAGLELAREGNIAVRQQIAWVQIQFRQAATSTSIGHGDIAS